MSHRIAIPLPDEIGEAIAALVRTLQEAEDPLEHRAQFLDVVRRATRVGLEHCFLRPLEIAQAGFLLRKPAGLAIISAERALFAIADRVLSRMSGEQVRSLVDFLDQLHDPGRRTP